MASGLSYEYPLLPIPEILVSFRESNIQVAENDLKHPDPRRWRGIYAQIFETLTQRPVEQVIQSLYRVERMQTEYHDLSEEGFGQMAFTSCLQRVLSSFGFKSFSVRDVIQPSPKRVQRIASVFLNSVRHNQLRKAFAQDTLDRIQTSRGQFESVLDKNKRLKEILARAKEEQIERDLEFQKTQQELEQEQQSLSDINRQQEEERRIAEELKLKVAELESEKENLRQAIGSVQHERAKLSPKIVQSPERFKKELERYKIKVVELKAELGKREQTSSENRLLLEQTISIHIAVEKAVKLCKELLGDLEKENEVDVEIQRHADAHHEQKEIYNSLCSQEEDLIEKLRVRQEQLYKITSQIDLREQSTQQHLIDLRQHRDKLQEECKNLEAELSQLQSRIVRTKEDLDSLGMALEDKKREMQMEMLEAIEELSNLQDVVNQGWADFRSCVDSED